MFKMLATLGVLMFCAFAIWGDPQEGQAMANRQAVKPLEVAPKVTPASVRPTLDPSQIEVARAAPPPTSFKNLPKLVGEPVLVSLITPQSTNVASNNQPLDGATNQAPSLADAITPSQFRVTGSRVNVRGGPSTGNAVVGTVSAGEIVEELSKPNQGWVEIRSAESGVTGFMSAKFLDAL